MARSLYKLFPFPLSSFKPINTFREQKFKLLFTRSFLKRGGGFLCTDSDSKIVPSMVGQQVVAYNGKVFNAFVARRSMIALSVKHLIRTKKVGYSMHVTKKKKKKK